MNDDVTLCGPDPTAGPSAASAPEGGPSFMVAEVARGPHARPRPRVAVADTGSGNLRSVEKALAAAGADVVVTADPEALARADKLVVPGQGAFGGCMAGLERHGGALRQAIVATIAAGKPYLGICLGMQILFERSEEEPGCAGLGVLPGEVRRFVQSPGLKIPHMGWNATHGAAPAGAGAGRPGAGRSASSQILGQVREGTYFYFVHSYFAAPSRPEDVALTARHGVAFCAAVGRDNVFACQFHPEKSQAAGLALLSAFVAV
jgi:imidazole glycerol-phosphate synthase subunit HisH